MTTDSEKFARLGRPERIWAVGAVFGEVQRLAVLHDHLAQHFAPGDRLIYLGNFLGRGSAVGETVDELLHFRRELLAVPGMFVSDIVYLRGAQEEMWQKLLQLQFAPNPAQVLRWMLSQGVDKTLACYGGRAEEGIIAARDGAVQLTRWTNRLREAMRGSPGHTNLLAALKRAAFTEPEGTEPEGGVLMVSAGIDATRPLAAQGDSFWWNTAEFANITTAYEGYRRLIRGFDGAGGGLQIEDVTATLDAGCGRGGRLAAGLFSADGEAVDIIEV